MTKQRFTVDAVLPNWGFCNLQSPHNKKCKTDEVCRFCKEVKKRGEAPRYYCTIFNIELAQKRDAIERASICVTGWAKNQILDLTKEPAWAEDSVAISPKEVKKQIAKSLKDAQRTAETLVKQGMSVDKAYELASSIVLDNW